MRLVIVGLGNQGRKRQGVAGQHVVATVDPIAQDARYRELRDVPLDAFDAACVCTPDQAKVELLRYLLSHGKHVLVEKPLLANDAEEIAQLATLAQRSGAACYTAYNHRFEPLVIRLRELLASDTLGSLYCARLFYGNGTARDVQASAWRDQGLGVLSDLGSHLLDLACFLIGRPEARLEAWGLHRFENRACDHVRFGTVGHVPSLEFEASLVSWRNTFTIDVFGALGSAHVNGLCKWGGSTLTIRQRVFPSGKPQERVEMVSSPDQTWTAEYSHFLRLCQTGTVTLDHDRWLNDMLQTLAQRAGDTALR